MSNSDSAQKWSFSRSTRWWDLIFLKFIFPLKTISDFVKKLKNIKKINYPRNRWNCLKRSVLFLWFRRWPYTSQQKNYFSAMPRLWYCFRFPKSLLQISEEEEENIGRPRKLFLPWKLTRISPDFPWSVFWNWSQCYYCYTTNSQTALPPPQWGWLPKTHKFIFLE